ncbi:hypothetical protein KIN20_018823 [Parelaphostrongylus tenuis]|uniref:Uncharacterized protein n=1 Tax=Parelaphostrongylus tenuis TaxID=148309 RepID=A0AAD5QSD8_PARTN|nr:hypothetical protein KIN20_018823 [Parelaphostrongylus tenuis]
MEMLRSEIHLPDTPQQPSQPLDYGVPTTYYTDDVIDNLVGRRTLDSSESSECDVSSEDSGRLFAKFFLFEFIVIPTGATMRYQCGVSGCRFDNTFSTASIFDHLVGHYAQIKRSIPTIHHTTNHSSLSRTVLWCSACHGDRTRTVA